MRLLAKKPADRPASAQEVVQQIAALERNLQGRGEGQTRRHKSNGSDRADRRVPRRKSPSPKSPPPHRRSSALIGAAAALLIAAAGAVVYVQTDNGTLEIKTDDKGVKVSVERDDQVGRCLIRSRNSI